MLIKSNLKVLVGLMMLMGCSVVSGAAPAKQYSLQDAKKSGGHALGMVIGAGLRKAGINPRDKTWGSTFLEKVMPGIIGAICKNFWAYDDKGKELESHKTTSSVLSYFATTALGAPKAFWLGNKHGKKWSDFGCNNKNLSAQEAALYYVVLSYAKHYKGSFGKDSFNEKENPLHALAKIACDVEPDDLVCSLAYERHVAFIVGTAIVVSTVVSHQITRCIMCAKSNLNKAMCKDIINAIAIPLAAKLLLGCPAFVNFVKKFTQPPSEDDCFNLNDKFPRPVVPDMTPTEPVADRKFPVVGATSRRQEKKNQPEVVIA